MIDRYLHSFVGPVDNNRFVSFRETVDGTGYASALKCTGKVDSLNIHSARVIGGHDACVDINNRAADVDVWIGEAHATGQFIATVKGGAIRPCLTIRAITKHGKVCDVILGDWSDQSAAWVEEPLINVYSENGPVTVIWLASDRPKLLRGSGPYRFKYWPRWTPLWLHWCIVYGFRTLRRWGFFRAQANKP